MIAAIKPLITEQTLLAAQHGWFTFVAHPDYNKAEISRAVVKHYKVNVTQIRTMTMHGKTHRVGKKMQTIKRSDWKKAIVKLKTGQKISDFEVTSEKA